MSRIDWSGKEPKDKFYLSGVVTCPCCGRPATRTEVPMPDIGGCPVMSLRVIGCECHEPGKITILDTGKK